MRTLFCTRLRLNLNTVFTVNIEIGVGIGVGFGFSQGAPWRIFLCTIKRFQIIFNFSFFIHSEINVLAAYLKILKGLPTGFRYKLKSRGLTADEQVKCLIDIARDPSVLGVSFYGYQPWL